MDAALLHVLKRDEGAVTLFLVYFRRETASFLYSTDCIRGT